MGRTGAGDLCGIWFGAGGTLHALAPTTDQLLTIGLPNGGSTVIGTLGFNLTWCGLALEARDGQHPHRTSRKASSPRPDKAC